MSAKLISSITVLLFLGVALLPAPLRAGSLVRVSLSQEPETQTKGIGPSAGASGLQSQALLSAIGNILKQAAQERESIKTLPDRDQFLFPPLWTETREDREASVRRLLDSALDIVTDAPVLRLQDEIAKLRAKIAAENDKVAHLHERRLEAPETGMLPGILTDTQSSIDKRIARLKEDIKARQADIVRIKEQIGKALSAASIDLSKDKLDLLLDGVLGGDLLKLVTAFEVSKIADQRLATLLNESGDDLKAARRYFAMHAALFAMLVEAQGLLIKQIDTVYLVRLAKIMSDIANTGATTRELLQSRTREDQRKVLEANLKAQETSKKVSEFYKQYLTDQRRILAEARKQTVFGLRVADNTFETVEESFQLKALMEDAKPSFDAIQRLEAPGFEQIFHNENLKREFENLTQKLGPAS